MHSSSVSASDTSFLRTVGHGSVGGRFMAHQARLVHKRGVVSWRRAASKRNVRTSTSPRKQRRRRLHRKDDSPRVLITNAAQLRGWHTASRLEGLLCRSCHHQACWWSWWPNPTSTDRQVDLCGSRAHCGTTSRNDKALRDTWIWYIYIYIHI